jgi:hypothetical protein
MERTDDTQSTVFVPPLELTQGQPPPVAANGGLSYMSFDREGDAGTAEAIRDAMAQMAEGKVQAFVEGLEAAPPGPVETQWGPGFRSAEACIAHIRETGMTAPEGGVVAPLRYTVLEKPSYMAVSSHALWHDPARTDEQAALRQSEALLDKRTLFFPQVLRDARRIGDYYPGLSPDSPECMDRLGVALTHCESACRDFYDHEEVEGVFYPEMERLLLDFFPDAADALIFNHEIFDKDFAGDPSEDQDAKNPGVSTNYVNLVHNDLNDNSGRVRCRELLTKNLRNFGRTQHLTGAQADEKMSRRFISLNLAKPMETVQQWPFVLAAWPSFADQPYITNYRIYDDRVGETTRFAYRPDHEWYWIPQQGPTEVSMLKCYDSIRDGSVSRWSFHSACQDPTAPAGVPNRRNVVARAFVFF